MRPFLALLLLLSSFSLHAQGSKEYHQHRVRPTVPPYGLVKIKGLIEGTKLNMAEEERAIDKKAYESLSLREKFTYNMIHGEAYSKGLGTRATPGEDKKIFAFIADMFDDYTWSDRQNTFLATNRDSVIQFMRESIKRSKRVGVNFKHAILEINAKEMIPLLIDTYKADSTIKDLDILSLCLQMMKENEFAPFIATGMYRKLYGEGNQAYLNYNKANEDLVIQRAMNFYNATRK